MLCFESVNDIVNPIDEETIMATIEFRNEYPRTTLSTVCLE